MLTSFTMLLRQSKEITGLENPNSVAQLKKWYCTYKADIVEANLTQKDKDLLLKDLSARLPYRPKCECDWKKTAPNGTVGYIDELSTFLIEQFEFADEFDDIPIKSIKPYLRPMSDMSEEDKKELGNFVAAIMFASQNKNPLFQLTREALVGDFFNKHHFDYRGLIEKGLAMKAPEGMYE